MSDLAEDFGQQQADNVLNNAPVNGLPPQEVREGNIPGTLPPVVTRPAAPIISQNRIGAPINYQQQVNSNKAAYSLLNRNQTTPHMDRSLTDLRDRQESVYYMSAFSGMEASYVAQNWDNLVKRMYPNVAPNPKKIVENFRAIKANATLLLDLNSWYERQMMGDTSQRTQEEIAARERNLMPMDEYIRLMPEGTFKRFMEERAYNIAEQGPQMRKTIGANIEGAITGGAAAAAAAIVAFYTGGASLLLQGGAAVGATGSLGSALGLTTQAATGAMVTAGAKVGGTVNTFDTLNRQLRGASYRSMINRMKDEGLDVSPRHIAQMSKIIGAIGAGLNTMEFGLLARFFGGTRAITKAFYEVAGTEKFLGAVGKAFGQRMLANGGTIMTENLLEVTEEVVEYVGEELFFKLQGADSTFDLTMEEFTDALKTITASTTTNTMFYGVGFGLAGGTLDASLTQSIRNSRGSKPLSGEAQVALRNVPDVRDAGMKIDEATGALDVNSVNDEVVEVDGAQINDMVLLTPEIEDYLSPAQKIIRDEYLRRNPSAARLNDALAFVTGRTVAELNGLASFSVTTIDDKVSRFANRLAAASPAISADGTISEITLPDGTPAGVSMTVDGDTVRIEYSSFEGAGVDGVVIGTITETGGIQLVSMEGDQTLGAGIFDIVAPGTTLFDRNVEVPAEYKADYDKLVAYSIKPHDSITLAETQEINNIIDRLQQKITDDKPITEAETYTREVPIVKDIQEDYWEEEEYTEMVEAEVEVAPLPELPAEVEPEVVVDELTTVPDKINRVLERFDAIYGENPGPEMAAKVAKSKARLLLAAKAMQDSAEAGANITEEDVSFLDDTKETLLDIDADYKKAKSREIELNKTKLFTEEGNPVPAIFDIDIFNAWRALDFAEHGAERIPISAVKAALDDYVDIIHKQVEPWSVSELSVEIDEIAQSLYDILPERGEEDVDGITRLKTIVDGETIPSEMDILAGRLTEEAIEVQKAIQRQQEIFAGYRTADGKIAKLTKTTGAKLSPENLVELNDLKRSVRDRYVDVYRQVYERLQARIGENEQSLYELDTIQHDLSRFYKAVEVMQTRLAAVNGLDAVQAPEIDDYGRTVLSLNTAFIAYYDKIVASMKEVYESHKGTQLSADMKEGDRRASIIEAYRPLLSIEAQEYFKGTEIDTAAVAGVFDDRAAIYEQNKKLLLFSDSTVPAYISPEQKANGDIDPSSAVVEPVQPDLPETVTEVRLVEKKGKRKVKKTRTIQETVMEAREFSRDPEYASNAERNQINKAISDAKTISSKAEGHIDEIVSVIQGIGGMVRSPKIRKFLDDLALEHGISYYGSDTEFSLDSLEGMTPDQMEQALASQLGKMTDMPMGELHDLYNEVLSAGKTDTRLTGYKAGDIEIPFIQMAKQIVGEIKSEDSIDNTDFLDGSKRKRRIAIDLAMDLYNSTLNYDLLIEKLRGKQSLTYKVLYQDIKDMSNAKRRFQFKHSKKYEEKFTNIPGVKDSGAYFDEVMIPFENFGFTKEMLLSLLQHKRNKYNWGAIKKNGLSISGAFKGIKMSPDTQGTILNFVELYFPNESDAYVLQTFQDGMDELHILANERHTELYGTPLPKSEFYIHLRPDNSFDQTFRPMRYRSVDDVRLVFDTPNVYERKGTNKPIRLTRIGDEFVSTTEAISDFYFMEKPMTRAETLVNTPEFKNAVVSRYTRGYLSYIDAGLTRWAGERISKDAFDTILDKTRKLRGKAVLTLNPEVAFKQVLSYPMFGIYVDAKYLTNAVMDVAANGDKIDATLKAWSTNYLTRGEGSGSWEIADTMRKRGGRTLTRGSTNFDKIQWRLIRTADKVTIRTGMHAAMLQFNAEVERGYFSDTVKDALDIDDTVIPKMSPDQKMQNAARFADYVLERTQPMHNPEHASHFQRSSAVSRSFSAFGSFTNQVNNVIARTYSAMRRGDPGAMKSFIMAGAMAAFTVPAITGFFDAGRRVAWNAVKGREYEDDSYWKLFGEAYITNVTGYWFVMRDFAKFALAKIRRGAGAAAGIELPLIELVALYFTAAGQFSVAINPSNSPDTRENAVRNMAINLAKAAAYSTGFSYYPMKFVAAAVERGKE